MALYHLHCDIIGRSGGRSATAAAAYRATEKINDITTGETFDFTKKEKAVYTEILADCELPQWAKNRAELWNEVEKKENRKNSQFARSFDVALQKELSYEENLECIKKWIKINYTSRGVIADLAIHNPHKNIKTGLSNDNLHAHILVTTRKINSDGWSEKDREGNDREFLKKVRTSWANIVNTKFKELGINEKIDERTLEEQGIDREPQQHQGAKATAMERKGKNPDRKKYKEQEKQEKIEITKEEIQEKLEKDNEYKHLKELLKNEKNNAEEIKEIKNWIEKIQNMTPREWQQFTKNMDAKNYVYDAYGEYTQTIMQATKKSKLIWIEKNIEPITKDFEKNYKSKKANYENYLNQKPHSIAERPSGLKTLMYNYETDKGNVYSARNYDNYRIEQQELINDWKRGKTEPQSNFEIAKNELKSCYEKNYNEVKTAIERHYPTLRERMRIGAEKLFNTLKEFFPVHAMIQVVRKFKPQKDFELKEFQRQKRRENPIEKHNEHSR